MYYFLNKLILKKIKKFIALNTLGKPKNFNKTPLGETGCLGILTFCLLATLIHFPLLTHPVRPPFVT